MRAYVFTVNSSLPVLIASYVTDKRNSRLFEPQGFYFCKPYMLGRANGSHLNF